MKTLDRLAWRLRGTKDGKRRHLLSIGKNNYHPVFLSDEQYKNYYEGYSNSTLWPLCHYFFAYTLYKRTFGNHIGKSMLFFVKRYLG